MESAIALVDSLLVGNLSTADKGPGCQSKKGFREISFLRTIFGQVMRNAIIGCNGDLQRFTRVLS